MNRRDFLHNLGLSAASVSLTNIPAYAADDEFDFDGTFLAEDEEEDALYVVYHTQKENLFCKSKILERGQIIGENSGKYYTYHENQFLLFPYNLPKNNFDFFLSLEADLINKRISKCHVISVDPNNMELTVKGHLDWKKSGFDGTEKLLLLLENEKENEVINLLFSHHNEFFIVTLLEENGDYCLQKRKCLEELAGVSLEKTTWSGPHSGLLGDSKNAFFVNIPNNGIHFYEFNNSEVTKRTIIQHNQQFGDFQFYNPNLTLENVGQNKSQIFSVIKSHAPKHVLNSTNSLVISDYFGIHFLNFSTITEQFEWVHSDYQAFEQSFNFVNLQFHYQKLYQPDLFLFKKEGIFYGAVFQYFKGKFHFDLNPLPIHDNLQEIIYFGNCCKANPIKKGLQNPEQNDFEYPLQFNKKEETLFFTWKLGETESQWIPTGRFFAPSDHETTQAQLRSKPITLGKIDQGILIVVIVSTVLLTAVLGVVFSLYGSLQAIKKKDTSMHQQPRKSSLRRPSVESSLSLSPDVERRKLAEALKLAKEEEEKLTESIHTLVEEREKLEQMISQEREELWDEIRKLQKETEDMRNIHYEGRITQAQFEATIREATEKNHQLQLEKVSLEEEKGTLVAKIDDKTRFIQTLQIEIGNIKGRLHKVTKEESIGQAALQFKQQVLEMEKAKEAMRTKIALQQKTIVDLRAKIALLESRAVPNPKCYTERSWKPAWSPTKK